MSYRYTGYAVSGLDVFYWILLTAGSLSFPIVVLAICCIRKHIQSNKNVKKLTHLLDGDVFTRRNMANINKNFFSETSVNEANSANQAEASQSFSKNYNAPSKPAISNYANVKSLNEPNKFKSNISTNQTSRPNNYTTNNADNLNRDIYSISDSYENAHNPPDFTNYSKINPTSFSKNYSNDDEIMSQYQQSQPSHNQQSGANFDNLYSQVTKKPAAAITATSPQNSYLKNTNNYSYGNNPDQGLYMNTYYNR